MPLAALESGVPGTGRRSASTSTRLERQARRSTPASSSATARCAATSWAPTPSAARRPTTQLDGDGRELLHESIEAGGLGFSTTLSNTHSDGDGKPVPSPLGEQGRAARAVRRGRRARGHHARGHRRRLPRPVQRRRDRAARARCRRRRERPLNWNVLTVDSREPDRVPRQLEASKRAPRAGRPGRRADDAGARADEHELPAPTARCS